MKSKPIRIGLCSVENPSFMFVIELSPEQKELLREKCEPYGIPKVLATLIDCVLDDTFNFQGGIEIPRGTTIN